MKQAKAASPHDEAAEVVVRDLWHGINIVDFYGDDPIHISEEAFEEIENTGKLSTSKILLPFLTIFHADFRAALDKALVPRIPGSEMPQSLDANTCARFVAIAARLGVKVDAKSRARLEALAENFDELVAIDSFEFISVGKELTPGSTSKTLTMREGQTATFWHRRGRAVRLTVNSPQRRAIPQRKRA